MSDDFPGLELLLTGKLKDLPDHATVEADVGQLRTIAARLSRYEAALRGIADYDFEQGVATWNTAVSIARAALSDGETE